MVIISSLISYYYHTPKDSWNKVGKYLNKHANPADTILILGGDSDYLGYYYNGPSEILDAGFIFKEKSDIDDMIDFINYVENSDCKWIFISQHSNKLFGNVFGSYKIENLESIRTILQEQFDKIEKVYTLEAHDLKEIDLPGLYRSTDCKPQ